MGACIRIEDFYLKIYLKSFSLSVKGDIDNQVALDKLSSDVGLLGMMQIRAKVKDEPGFLPGPDKHWYVDAGSERCRFCDVDECDAVRRVLVTKRRGGVIWKKIVKI